MILAGLWFASEKPPMQLLLQPVVDNLKNLETEGAAYDTLLNCDDFKLPCKLTYIPSCLIVFITKVLLSIHLDQIIHLE